jgi:cytochrome c2
MNRLLAIASTLGIAAIALSLSMFVKPFDTTYKVAKGSKLDKAACTVCHATSKGGKLNGYGTDLKAAMKADNTKKVTPGVLAKIESKDSDGDGVKNIDEIKKDSNPGVK